MLGARGCRRRCLRRRRLILLAFRGLARRSGVIVIGISVAPPGPGCVFRALRFVRRRRSDCHRGGWRNGRRGGRSRGRRRRRRSRRGRRSSLADLRRDGARRRCQRVRRASRPRGTAVLGRTRDPAMRDEVCERRDRNGGRSRWALERGDPRRGAKRVRHRRKEKRSHADGSTHGRNRGYKRTDSFDHSHHFCSGDPPIGVLTPYEVLFGGI
jgi:hypothetical protein